MKQDSKSKHFYRIAPVEDGSADDNEKTVQVLFSSETPVERKATAMDEQAGIAKKGTTYLEVLSHDDGDADLSSLNRNAPVLDEHDDRSQIGNVKRAKISKDKVGRALIQFDGDSDLSNLRFKQHSKGNRQISVGYTRTKFLGNGTSEDGRAVKRFAWEPDEITSTARAADPRAGSYRSLSQKCLSCGNSFPTDEINDAGDCEDCANYNEGRGHTKDRVTAVRSLIPADSNRVFRAADDEFSHNDLKQKVATALHKHPGYKKETEDGNTYSDFYLSDIYQSEGGFHAIVVGPSPNYQLYKQDFDFDGSDVLLGEETPVVATVTHEPVGNLGERKAAKVYAFKDTDLTIDFQLVRSAGEPYGDVNYADPGYQKDGKKRYPLNTKAHAKAAWSYWNKPKNQAPYTPKQKEHIEGKIKAACKKFGVDISDKSSRSVDSKNSVTRKTRTQNMETPISELTLDELSAENPKLVAAIGKQARSKFEAEVQTQSETRSTKMAERKKEINAIADEAVKSYGLRWKGPAGQVFVLGEKIRAHQQEALAADASQEISEVRMDFKRKIMDLVEGSREPKEQVSAANLPSEIASRCSLGNIMRRAAKDIGTGRASKAWMMPEGAEFEADKEIRHRAMEFPGGSEGMPEGTILPPNMPTRRINRSRMESRYTRDALAGDFPTAGALVAPELIFPAIELLRNMPALSRAGMTILSGVMGNLVLPRQVAPTVAQALAEGGAAAQYDQDFDQIKLFPHRLNTSQKYSRLALLQATPDFEALVMRDHMAVMALAIDEMALNGSGGGDQPLGILNQLGIGVVAFGGLAATAYKNCIALETAIRKANIYDPVTFITTSAARGTLRITPATLTGSTVVSGQSTALWTGADEEEECVGRPAIDSQQVPNDILLALVGHHVVMAQWGGLAVVLDTISQASSDKYWLNINTYIDIALRHAQAVARSADPLTTLI